MRQRQVKYNQALEMIPVRSNEKYTVVNLFEDFREILKADVALNFREAVRGGNSIFC